MKTRMTIFQQRHWEKNNDLTGELIEKFYYAGFPEKGKPFEFSTNRSDIVVHNGVMKFEASASEEFDLETIYDSFKGQLKLREAGSAGL